MIQLSLKHGISGVLLVVFYASFAQSKVENNRVPADSIHPNATTELDAVQVNAQKKAIKKTAEGFVFTASTALTQTGGTAIDLLKNIPTLSVDGDGVLSLRGKMPLILIDGKNSAITNLDQIAASSIESVEVITNPTSKYDANAESGIINIKLKKNKQNGTNGAMALGTGLGAKGRVNSSLQGNHQYKKWNFGLGYDNRFAGRTKHIQGNRINYNLADEHELIQSRADSRFEQLQNLQATLDFAPNDKHSFALELVGNTEGQDNNETLKSLELTNTSAFYSSNQRHSLELERSKVAEMSFTYDRKFSNTRKSVRAGITSSVNNAHENTNIDTYNFDATQNPIGSVVWQRTHNYENENISNAFLHIALPLSPKSMLETGYKGTFRLFSGDFQTADLVGNNYVINPAGTSIFHYQEQIEALYTEFNSHAGSAEKPTWEYNLGLRVEQVANTGHTNTANTTFSNAYTKFFPSAALGYHLSENSSLKLSFSKRINRPELGQLNPFVDITDALNPHTGNPYLKPELITTYELGYALEHTTYSVSLSGFYREGQNTIKLYAQPLPNGVVLIAPENFGVTQTYGLESILSWKPLNAYNCNLSITAFEQQIDGSNLTNDVASKAFNWYGKWVQNIVPWEGGKIQLIGNYNSKLATPQGNRIALYSADLGYQQKLTNSNSRLGLVVTDMFNTLVSGYQNYTTSFSNSRRSKSDSRAVMLSFAYTFKSSFKEKLLENQFTPEF